MIGEKQAKERRTRDLEAQTSGILNAIATALAQAIGGVATPAGHALPGDPDFHVGMEHAVWVDN